MQKAQELSFAGRTDTREKRIACVLTPASTGSEVLPGTTASIPPLPQPRAGQADTVLLPGVAGSRHTAGWLGSCGVFTTSLFHKRTRLPVRHIGSTDPACRAGHKREPWPGSLAAQPSRAWEETPPPRAPSTLQLSAGSPHGREPWPFLSAPRIHWEKLGERRHIPAPALGACLSLPPSSPPEAHTMGGTSHPQHSTGLLGGDDYFPETRLKILVAMLIPICLA